MVRSLYGSRSESLCCSRRLVTYARRKSDGERVPTAATPSARIGSALETPNSVVHGASSPVAIVANRTAVGLPSARSARRSIERLASHLAATASNVISSFVRSVRMRLDDARVDALGDWRRSRFLHNGYTVHYLGNDVNGG